MKINLVNEKMDVNPEVPILVTKKRFFEIFFRVFQIRYNKTLSDNEIELLASYCSNTETKISKNNLGPVIKKLNEKGLMEGRNLSDLTKAYVSKFVDEVSIVMNFNIVSDEG